MTLNTFFSFYCLFPPGSSLVFLISDVLGSSKKCYFEGQLNFFSFFFMNKNHGDVGLSKLL
jgi:hypothetical protein